MSTASAPPPGPAPVEQQEPRGTLGLGTATALIVGTIIGVGIFDLPSSLATYGPISLLAMVLTTIGAPAVLATDLLVIATDVDAVHLDRGTPAQRAVVRAHPDGFDPGLFPAGSMGPKVEAAAHVARATGTPAVIGSLDQLSAMLACDGGTRISVQTEGMATR